MSVLLSKIVLVYIVSTQPLLHFQIVEGFSADNLDVCQAVIAKVAEQEKNEPADEQIHEHLGCIRLSHRYDPDGDGPSKPSAPMRPNSSPMFKSGNTEDVPCKSKEGHICRDASLFIQ